MEEGGEKEEGGGEAGAGGGGGAGGEDEAGRGLEEVALQLLCTVERTVVNYNYVYQKVR